MSLDNYSRYPQNVSGGEEGWPEPRYRVSLVACARWETRYIYEWISYHRSLGFEHLYLYCNDDDPAELYQEVLPFVEAGFVTFTHYPKVGLQLQMYFHFNRKYMAETAYFMFLDIDEFVCLPKNKSIHALLEEFPDDLEMLYFNWCNFGHNGHKVRPSGGVLTNYTRREEGANPNTKIIYKSQSFQYREFFLNPDHPVQHDGGGLKPMVAYSVLGERIDGYFASFPQNAWAYLMSGDRRFSIMQKAFIAHFCIKSDEDFDLRVRRGLRGNFASEKMWGEKSPAERQAYHDYTNAVEDCRLRDYWKSYLASRIQVVD